MLADSLPDKYGDSLLYVWLSSNKISTKETTLVDHLSFIGSRAMGALEFELAKQLGDNTSFDVNIRRISF